MPGIIEKIIVKPGDSIKKGDNIAVVIAMKMEVMRPCSQVKYLL